MGSELSYNVENLVDSCMAERFGGDDGDGPPSKAECEKKQEERMWNVGYWWFLRNATPPVCTSGLRDKPSRHLSSLEAIAKAATRGILFGSAGSALSPEPLSPELITGEYNELPQKYTELYSGGPITALTPRVPFDFDVTCGHFRCLGLCDIDYACKPGLGPNAHGPQKEVFDMYCQMAKDLVQDCTFDGTAQISAAEDAKVLEYTMQEKFKFMCKINEKTEDNPTKECCIEKVGTYAL